MNDLATRLWLLLFLYAVACLPTQHNSWLLFLNWMLVFLSGYRYLRASDQWPK